MNCNCENCGWSEIVGSPIMCNYNGHRTWRDECCEAWKPKEKETNMVEVVRCQDCKYNSGRCQGIYIQFVTCCKTGAPHKEDWYCADGERKDNDA